MKIGLVGYFGWGNYGDELFYQCYQQLFPDHELVLFHDPLNSTLVSNFEQVVNSVDKIIIGGGDLIIPWSKSWLYWNDLFLTKPIYIYGVGVPTWGGAKPELLEFYKSFLSHSNVKLIACRDEESKNWVQNKIGIDDPKLVYYPDLVLSMDFPKKEKKKILGVILRHQTQYVTENIERALNLFSSRGYKIKFILLGTGRTLKDDYEILHNFKYPNMDIVIRDNEESLSEEIAECQYLLSMKFHGIIAAYKMKVDFIPLSGADKFISFMKQTNNQEFNSNWKDEKLVEKCEVLLDKGTNFSNYDDLVSFAKQGTDFLRKSVLS
ncbi:MULTISPECIES: polysaccharide pyruvyl transferase family protein [Acinetobacter]|uniref:polysaccharide pyruvyl transferase family protein n=1 Tax=Acinetobacter TaxID=469 RepID=UPI001F4AD0AE|nr:MULTISPECIES: polysaccharide pyruvyl transferase family protein [Acinetobacter]MCH7379969.1 polysaccharide pyruvyl transferase family protein [Acinetobacter higginsii]